MQYQHVAGNYGHHFANFGYHWLFLN